MSELKQYLTEKIEMLKEIRNCQDRIKELTNKIENLNKYIYHACKHNWKRDQACSHDDLSKNYCTHCGLKDYKYLYN